VHAGGDLDGDDRGDDPVDDHAEGPARVGDEVVRARAAYERR
jgi:hypothetical protein